MKENKRVKFSNDPKVTKLFNLLPGFTYKDFNEIKDTGVTHIGGDQEDKDKPTWQLICNFVSRINSCDTTQQLLHKIKTLKDKDENNYSPSKKTELSDSFQGSKAFHVQLREQKHRNEALHEEELKILDLREDVDKFLKQGEKFTSWLKSLKRKTHVPKTPSQRKLKHIKSRHLNPKTTSHSKCVRPSHPPTPKKQRGRNMVHCRSRLNSSQLYSHSRYELSPGGNLEITDLGRFLTDKILALKMIKNDYVMKSVNFKEVKKEVSLKRVQILEKLCLELQDCNLHILGDPVFPRLFREDYRVMQIIHELKTYFKVPKGGESPVCKSKSVDDFKSRNKGGFYGIGRKEACVDLGFMGAGFMSPKNIVGRNVCIVNQSSIRSKLCNILSHNISTSSGSIAHNARRLRHSRSTFFTPTSKIPSHLKPSYHKLF